MDFENLRTVGGAPVGKLHRGAVGTVTAPTNTKFAARPSIPSRVETVLHHNTNNGSIGSSVEKAFGSTSYRFTDNSVDGRTLGTEYQARDSSLKSTKNKLNVSKHGTSAFASAKRAGFSSDAPIKVLPGPGHYDSWSTHVLDNVKSSLTTSCSSAFALPKSSNSGAIHAPIRKDYTSPGPGEYVLPDTFAAIAANQPSLVARNATSGAITSRAPRMPPALHDQLGGPGEHLPDSYVNEMSFKTSGQNRHSCNSGPSYYNASKTERNGAGISLSAANDGGFAGSPGRADASSRNVNRLLPAPLMRLPEGELSPHIAQALAAVATSKNNASLRGFADEMMPNNLNSKKPSAVFRETNLDRFGAPIVRYAVRADDSKVGPGSYSTLSEVKKKLVSSSWALDGSSRDSGPNAAINTATAGTAPGPAYYCPTKPPRLSSTSFHVRENLPKSDLTNAKFRYESAQQRYRGDKSTWL